mmetsp:Transcript_1003/g.4283  ORF Transcript_1003/g.4283 Transcript_1003/m.4283 type:complete len:394 (-) Transcript_1003:335-1516(-)
MLAPHYAGALFDALAENEEQVRLRRMLRHGRAKRLSDAMQSLIDTSEPVIITTVPPTLCVLAANTPMLNVLGAKGSDIIGSDVRELFHADPAFDSLIIAAGNTRHKEAAVSVCRVSGGDGRAEARVAMRPLLSAKMPRLRELCASHLEWRITALASRFKDEPDDSGDSGPEVMHRKKPVSQTFLPRAQYLEKLDAFLACISVNPPEAPLLLLDGQLPLEQACSMTLAHLCLYMLCSRDALVLTDFCGRIVLVNVAWEYLCQYNLCDVHGKTSAFLQTRNTDRNVTTNFMMALSKGLPACMVVENMTKQRRPFINRVEAYPFFGELEPAMPSRPTSAAPGSRGQPAITPALPAPASGMAPSAAGILVPNGPNLAPMYSMPKFFLARLSEVPVAH